jgi:hypothetical protein
LTLLLSVSVLIYNFDVTIVYYATLKLNADQWTECIFKNFDQKNPQQCRKICGNLPEDTFNFGFTSWVLLVSSGQSVLVAGINVYEYVFIFMHIQLDLQFCTFNIHSFMYLYVYIYIYIPVYSQLKCLR